MHASNHSCDSRVMHEERFSTQHFVQQAKMSAQCWYDMQTSAQLVGLYNTHLAYSDPDLRPFKAFELRIYRLP